MLIVIFFNYDYNFVQAYYYNDLLCCEFLIVSAKWLPITCIENKNNKVKTLLLYYYLKYCFRIE